MTSTKNSDTWFLDGLFLSEDSESVLLSIFQKCKTFWILFLFWTHECGVSIISPNCQSAKATAIGFNEFIKQKFVWNLHEFPIATQNRPMLHFQPPQPGVLGRHGCRVARSTHISYLFFN